MPDFAAIFFLEKFLHEKGLKCLVVSEIISNFAALKSMCTCRSVANLLNGNAMGDVVGV